MNNKRALIIAVFISLACSLPCAAFAEGQAMGLGQPVELTGGALPQQIRDFTGVGTGASSWDYLSQKITYGYFVEVYSHFDALAKAKVDRRNGVEDLVLASYKADNNANIAIADVKFNQDAVQQVMATEFAQRAGRGTQIANTYTMNTYLPHSDGSVEYFKDGLLARIDNQRSADEFGNVGFKNMYNFAYDLDRRLMLSHEYDRTDHMGNKTHGAFSCTYTADSVFYGSDQTNANKNYTSYKTTETDHTGKISTTTWTAGTYEGKYLRNFNQTTVENLPTGETSTSSLRRFNIQYSAPGQMSSYEEEGVAAHIEGETGSDVQYSYKLSRSNITYTAGQITGYDETRWDMDPDVKKWTSDLSKWVKTTSHVSIEYANAPHQFGADVEPDQARIKKQTITSKVENPDGSYRNDTSVLEYSYDAGYKLTGATGTNTFSGLSSDWIKYTDNNGHTLTKRAKHDAAGKLVKENGTIVYEYCYTDADNKIVIVATATDETSTAFTALVNSTTMDGSLYNGSSTTAYEIMSGTPVAKQTVSKMNYLGTDNTTVVSSATTTTTNTYGLVNNMVKLLASAEKTVSTQPQLDAAGAYPTTKTVTTTYAYDAKGYLTSVTGTGSSTGRDYSEEKGFGNPFTSAITVQYDIKLDKPLEIDYYEVFTYNNGSKNADASTAVDLTKYTSSEALLAQAWKDYGASNMSSATQLLTETIKRYASEALQQQASLSGFAVSGSESKYWALNDVATAEYLLGKIALKAGNTDVAKAHFNNVINNYGYAQCWDTRGWYWQVAKSAKEDLATIK